MSARVSVSSVRVAESYPTVQMWGSHNSDAAAPRVWGGSNILARCCKLQTCVLVPEHGQILRLD